MKKIVLPFLLLWALSSAAQQSASYTQYIFNGLVINPAYAGSKGVLNVTGLFRSQWSGLEGAPHTQTLAVDGTLLNQRIGLGLQLMNDELGAQRQRTINVSSAVRIKLGEKTRLSVGLSGGVSQFSIDGTKIRLIDPEPDAAIPATKESVFLPDVKAGIFFNTERYFLGISASNLITGSNRIAYTPARHYFLTSGYVFDLGSLLKFKPSFLVKEDLKSPTNIDLNAFFLIGDRLWLGGTYRMALKVFNTSRYQALELENMNAWALMAEVYVTPKIKVGYSNDMTLTSLQGHASHELSVGFFFFRDADSPSLTIRHF
ncbi:PorP/SprF family type IX secretion system membrane protein [Rufibacter quisquiliarum]|uniref:Type IX secretion system PorP/SprF family membrane protein n=1 Tax=Rufibacter quisquiliarum TaxID=1549639 RepID=A0A839GNX0_9BACT|nr:type IX secretion system membrane protein PorP/SprF [Rufibacter quisquiliarum]MBA9079653.1 type IX secretion system PorP/SprF family membrane protein [Rufibacter quisquiliarum]